MCGERRSRKGKTDGCIQHARKGEVHDDCDIQMVRALQSGSSRNGLVEDARADSGCGGCFKPKEARIRAESWWHSGGKSSDRGCYERVSHLAQRCSQVVYN